MRYNSSFIPASYLPLSEFHLSPSLFYAPRSLLQPRDGTIVTHPTQQVAAPFLAPLRLSWSEGGSPGTGSSGAAAAAFAFKCCFRLLGYHRRHRRGSRCCGVGSGGGAA